MMEPEEGGFSVAMPGAEIHKAEIGAASVSMPGAEIGVAKIGSEGASVAMSDAEIGTAVIGSGASVQSHVQHYHYYGFSPTEQAQNSAVLRKAKKTHPLEGYFQLTDDIFMSKSRLRKGTKVYKAYQQHADGSRLPLAVKIIHECEEKTLGEVRHLLTLASHPNIVRVVKSVKDDRPTGCDLYIIMELCSDRDLQDYLEDIKRNKFPLDFEKTMSFSRQILNGAKHIHRFKIIHRDLKPENILLLSDGENLKVTDFGISKELRDGQSVTEQTKLLGTDGFRAPETFTEGEISLKADVFSLGIILYQLWSNGKHAFGDDVLLRNHNITKNTGLDLSGLLISGKKKDELLRLIRWMLEPDPRARPTVEEALCHPFFRSAPLGEDLTNPAEDAKADVAVPVIGVIDKRSRTIQTFKPSDKSWDIPHDITNEIYEMRNLYTVAVDQVIFVLAKDKTSFKFDLSKPAGGWTELPLRSESGHVQVVECCGQVYAFHNKDKSSVVIEVLETDHTSWRKIRRPEPCRKEAITSTKASIYTFGGHDGSYLRRSMKFNPNRNLWTKLPDMLTARRSAAASVLEDKIYVLGGLCKDALRTTECFDVATEEWTMLKAMNHRHMYFNTFAFDDKVYAVGSGRDSYYNIPFVIEEYDPTTDTWKDIIEVSDKEIYSKATFVLHT